MTPLSEREIASDALGVPRHDWSARVRSSALDALRYTKFVGVMKRALQVGAFAMITAVLAFFFFQRQPARITMGFEHLGHLENDLAMIKPRLSGQNGDGNPFVITADAAIQDAKNPKRARLTKVEADLSLDRGSWLNANAARGQIDMQVGLLQLDGGLNVFSDQGYELHTASAAVDINKGVVHGREEVTGQGPMGSLRADQFQIDRNHRLLTLNGHVQMTLLGKKA
jgi:lipopolysaccharide export system protein LptC